MKTKRTAEEWVKVAREFGEKCVEIQHDSKLSSEKKLEKQKILGKEMAKEIQEDPHLTSKDKEGMLNSLQTYVDDWSKVGELLKTYAAKKEK